MHGDVAAAGAQRDDGPHRQQLPAGLVFAQRFRRDDRAGRAAPQVQRRRPIVAGHAKGVQLTPVGQHGREPQRLLDAVGAHQRHRVVEHRQHSRHHRLTARHARHRQQEQQLRIGAAAARGVQVVRQPRFEHSAQLQIATDLSVVHEQVGAVAKRVAILARNPARRGGAHMGEEQPGAQRVRQREQVVVGPRRHHFAIDAGLVAFAVPADAETVAVGRRLGLDGTQRLPHQRMVRRGDQRFQVHRFAQVGGKSAHVDTSVMLVRHTTSTLETSTARTVANHGVSWRADRTNARRAAPVHSPARQRTCCQAAKWRPNRSNSRSTTTASQASTHAPWMT